MVGLKEVVNKEAAEGGVYRYGVGLILLFRSCGCVHLPRQMRYGFCPKYYDGPAQLSGMGFGGRRTLEETFSCFFEVTGSVVSCSLGLEQPSLAT